MAQWRADPTSVLAEIRREDWASGPLIVRSSARGEDSATGSQAGKYLSLLGVESSGLSEAIERVAASYGRRADDDRVLVQPLLSRVAISGAAFTRDPSTGAPSLVVNACEGSDTAAVTGGSARSWCHHHWLDGPEAQAPVIRSLTALSIAQIRRIESLLREHGLETDVVGLFDFLQAAIEGREKAKFIFTRNLAGAIVCIPGADPGYDWIFSQGIAGLITAFGGANSHMAIRAAELGIPAVIGAGEINCRRDAGLGLRQPQGGGSAMSILYPATGRRRGALDQRWSRRHR